MSSPLEDELRAALRAAAANVDVSEPSRSPFDTPVTRRTPHRSRRTWLGITAIAAAVAVVAVSAVLLARGQHPDPRPTAGLTVDGATAVVDGVRFPIPSGSHVDTLTDMPLSIAVCVQQARSSTCTGGVTVTIARPDATGHYAQLPNPALNNDCQWVTQHGVQQLADRPAEVVSVGCNATNDGPTSLVWYLNDGTLSITTPPGIAATQAEEIASGVDLSGWGNLGEQELVTQTS